MYLYVNRKKSQKTFLEMSHNWEIPKILWTGPNIQANSVARFKHLKFAFQSHQLSMSNIPRVPAEKMYCLLRGAQKRNHPLNPSLVVQFT